MPPGTKKDDEDIFVENINTALFLFLGGSSVFASVILLFHSATAVVYRQQSLMNFLFTSIFAAFLFFLGLGSLLLFRKRRRLRKTKSWFDLQK